MPYSISDWENEGECDIFWKCQRVGQVAGLTAVWRCRCTDVFVFLVQCTTDHSAVNLPAKHRKPSRSFLLQNTKMHAEYVINFCRLGFTVLFCFLFLQNDQKYHILIDSVFFVSVSEWDVLKKEEVLIV